MSGVRGVVNDIEVRLTEERGDPEIAEAAANALQWNAMVPANRVTAEVQRAFQRQAALDANQVAVEVSGNVVTLRGEVRTLAERRQAERAAWAAPGVSDARNHLTANAAI